MEDIRKSKTRETKEEIKKRKISKDITECMRCRFFWGNDSRCINNSCIKDKEKKPKKEEKSECTDCPYKQSEGYCFPCMKKLLKRK